jgi:hypothetical protein
MMVSFFGMILKFVREPIWNPNEAYSLFQENPYHRVQVFAGSLEWAIQRSDEVVKELS